jgi:hypothetical protein
MLSEVVPALDNEVLEDVVTSTGDLAGFGSFFGAAGLFNTRDDSR